MSVIEQRSSTEVEREALFFAVLRERIRPVAEPAALAEADTEITAWLDEAEEEGAAILERARQEAAQIRLAGHQHVEDVRLAAERAAAEAERRAVQIAVDAEDAALQRRRQAAEEAGALLAETRAAAERRLEEAEAEAEATADRALAVVRSLQSDVGALQRQLTQLVEGAMALLPALDLATRALDAAPAPVAALDPPPSLSRMRRLVRGFGTKNG